MFLGNTLISLRRDELVDLLRYLINALETTTDRTLDAREAFLTHQGTHVRVPFPLSTCQLSQARIELISNDQSLQRKHPRCSVSSVTQRPIATV